MKLSLNKILNEITARIGPRTGGFEINLDTLWQTARTIVNAIYKRRAKNRHFFISNIHPITGEKVTTRIRLFPVGLEGSEAEWNQSENSIDLFILDKKFIKLPSSELINLIFSLLTHELTHKFDPSVLAGKYSTFPEVGYNQYLNQPVEIKAHLQQVVDEIQRKIPGLKEKLKKVAPEEYKKNILQLRQKPLHILELSPRWRDIKNSLTPENERRFLKAGARLTYLL